MIFITAPSLFIQAEPIKNAAVVNVEPPQI